MSGRTVIAIMGGLELIRLQRILFHRELGVPLGEIAELLALEGEDQVGVLMRHRERLEAERARFRILIETIDRTVASMKGETHMSNTDLYQGFRWRSRQTTKRGWSSAMAHRCRSASIFRARRWRRSSEAEQAALMDTLKDIETGLVEGMKRGIDPAAEPVDRMIARHRAWVAVAWDKPVSARRRCGTGGYVPCRIRISWRGMRRWGRALRCG